MPIRPFAPLLALPALCGAALADEYEIELPQPADSQAGYELSRWPEGLGGGFDAIRAVDVGEVDGEDSVDAVVHCGEALYLMTAIADHGSVAELDAIGGPLGPVSAHCLVPTPSGRSLVAASTASGLRLLAHDGGARFVDVSVASLGPGWERCRRLIAADGDLDGDVDLFGLGEEGLVVRTALQDPTLGWFPGLEYLLAAEAHDVTPLEWSDDVAHPLLEVAYSSVLGIEVLAPGPGPPLYVRGSAFLHDAELESVRVGSGKPDVLAAAVGDPSLSSALLLVLQEDLTEAHALGVGDPADLVAGDFDGDGDDDLAVQWKGSLDVLMLTQLDDSGPDPGPVFDAVEAAVVNESFDPDGTIGGGLVDRGVLVDATGDGRTDLVVPAHDGIATLYGPLEHTIYVGTTPLPLVERNSVDLCVVFDPAANSCEGRLTFDLLHAPLDSMGANSFRVAIWYQEDRTSALEPVSLCTRVEPADLLAERHSFRVRLPELASWQTQSHEADCWADWAFDERVFHIQVRAFDAEDPAVPASPGTPVGVSALYSVSFDQAAATTFPYADGWGGMLEDNVMQCSGPVGGSQPVGGSGQTKKIPRPLPGEIPGHGAVCPIY